MLTVLFMIMMLVVFGKIFGFALRATWGITKIVFSIVLLPLFLVALVFMGLIWVAFPVLLIVGIVSLFVCRNQNIFSMY